MQHNPDKDNRQTQNPNTPEQSPLPNTPNRADSVSQVEKASSLRATSCRINPLLKDLGLEESLQDGYVKALYVPWRRFAAMSWLRYSKVVSGWQVPPSQFGIDESGTPSCSSFLIASLLEKHKHKAIDVSSQLCMSLRNDQPVCYSPQAQCGE
jgi:hypothetical protein